jgi:ubiquinone/menaquinone biosynthesis C-methylase UbiE
MSGARVPQLAYSEIQHLTHDEAKRRQKAAKIQAVLEHFLGRSDLEGLVALDVGSSTGFTCAALHEAGAKVIGVDIDQPGLSSARERFAGDITFLCADGSRLPLADASVDLVVLSHIYEHVVDPAAVMSEIVRVLRPEGVAYLAFGNKWQVVEPHYRLPFLSWLPRRLADRYIRATGKADTYYEQFRGRRDLLRMSTGLHLWDYTYTLLADSERFAATDLVPGPLRSASPLLWRLTAPVIPTYVWVGTPGQRAPQGTATRVPPSALAAG